VAGADDSTVEDDDGADGHFAGRRREVGLGERLMHERVVHWDRRV
jgi:hypothetical protein